MPLTLPQRKILLDVMRELFTTLDDLKTFIRDSTGRNLEEIVVGNLANSRSSLIDNATSWEWLGELIEALKDVAGPAARAKLETVEIRGAFAASQRDLLAATMKRSLSTQELLEIVQDRLGQEVVAGNVEGALGDAAATHFIALAKAVRGMRAVNPELRRQLEQLGLLASTPENLEKIVNESNSFLDIAAWLGRLTEIEGYVCRIATQAALGLRARGSGFLVGPSIVLTNHHVVADVDPKQLRVQFDYRVLKDGSTDSGTIVGVNHHSGNSWKIDVAPHGAIDTQVHPIEIEPAETELDYALLRLDTPVGSLPIGPAAQGTALKKRGWLDLTQCAAQAEVSTAIVIVQHPSGLPMKLAFETNGVVGYSPNGLRMRYRTNTLRGSSGSPVFNQDLEILALHHAGDPEYPKLDSGEYNEGIPIPALLKQLKQRNVLAMLSE
jgi:V8-like Glu-specific endopeptidase